jgi:S1-C subfamily serine protease
MARLSIVHVSGPRSGQTDALARLPARIGSADDAHVRIPGLAPHHATLVSRHPDVVLLDAGSEPATFLAGHAVREASLRDGDVLELGAGGPRVRFHVEGRARRAGLTRGLVRRLVRETSGARPTRRSIRIAAAMALLVTSALVAWNYRESMRLEREVVLLLDRLRAAEEERRSFQQRVDGARRRSEAEQKRLESQVEEFRQREEQLRQQLAAAHDGEVQGLKRELRLTRGRLAALEVERAVGERIIRDYGNGVCLIQGSYAFDDSAGRPLRYHLDDRGNPRRDKEGSLELDVSATGPVHTVDYFGTGFLVDKQGHVLTNRHIAQPWWNDGTSESLEKAGYRPRFVVFRAFFPTERAPFDLAVVRHSDSLDLALVRVGLKGRKIPPLPLDTEGRGAVAGQRVVVVGYPTGLEAILAKTDSRVAQEILDAHGKNSERVTESLSRKGLIRPSTTQGHIGDVTKTDIVFDAATTVGGSGGPVFNKDGLVIAVEYAVLPKFGGNSFGVPIRYALDLLHAGAGGGSRAAPRDAGKGK